MTLSLERAVDGHSLVLSPPRLPSFHFCLGTLAVDFRQLPVDSAWDAAPFVYYTTVDRVRGRCKIQRLFGFPRGFPDWQGLLPSTLLARRTWPFGQSAWRQTALRVGLPSVLVTTQPRQSVV